MFPRLLIRLCIQYMVYTQPGKPGKQTLFQKTGETWKYSLPLKKESILEKYYEFRVTQGNFSQLFKYFNIQKYFFYENVFHYSFFS